MKVFILLAACVLFSGCASTPQSKHIRAAIPDRLPLAVELADTPFFPQTAYQCGPAALATVLQSHGVITTPEALSHQVYIPGRKGSLQIEITATARQHGMLAYQIAPQLLDVFSEIAAGNPVMVLQNLGFAWYPQWHYAVIVGYDIDRREIQLRSGTLRRRTTSFEVFERSWQRAEHWALVIVPAGQIPRTANLLPYLKTAYAFEATGQPALALTAYQAASRQWPGQAVSWMTLGNLAFQQQDWSSAIDAFSTATRLDAASVDSWNNLAYALHAAGCGAQAQAALQCALNISADDANLQDSLQALLHKPVGHSHVQCPLIACD